MFIILCVLDQPDHLNAVLQAWQQHGIKGVTMLESTGLHRLSEQMPIPMRYTFGSAGAERGNITLFTVVEHEATIQTCLAITEQIVGDFEQPNTGIFIAWPLGFAKGVTGKHSLS